LACWVKQRWRKGGGGGEEKSDFGKNRQYGATSYFVAIVTLGQLKKKDKAVTKRRKKPFGRCWGREKRKREPKKQKGGPRD